jgi:uncharacterized membrane protein
MPETMTFQRTRQGLRDLDKADGPVLPVSGGPVPRPAEGVNVGETERWLCGLTGGAMALSGLSRGGLCGLGLAALGGALAYRALSGHCPLFQSLGINTAGRGLPLGAEYVYRTGS